MAKKNVGIATPILTARCEKCGKLWAKSHPKDNRALCEYCRKDSEVNKRT